MALVVNDRVKETSTTTGTGTFSLAGAESGFESFVAGIGNSNTTYYAIVNENGEFEVGLGTVTDASPDTLSRDTIISSSNSDSAVNFSAGTKDVFCTLPASKAVIEDANSDVTLPADLNVSVDLDVDGLTTTDGLTNAGNFSTDGGTIKLDGNYPVGSSNVALGNTALDSVASGGANNVAIGNNAGTALTTVSSNVALRPGAFATASTGSFSLAIGLYSLGSASSNSYTAVGHRSIRNTSSATYKTAV